MKHHLNIIILALRIAIVITAIEVVNHLWHTVYFFTEDGPEIVKEFFSNYFTPVARNMPYRNNEWFGATFCIIYAALLLYVLFGIKRLLKCLKDIKKGKMFYHTQGKEFRKAGATIIIFAKAKYILFCSMAAVYYDITIFFTELPWFLSVYLIEKLILLLSYMAEKGEYIKEEIDLTI